MGIGEKLRFLKKWVTKRRRTWLFALILDSLAVWLWDRFQTMLWVGSTDLEIEFAVTDAATGRPVEAAKIEIDSDGGFYAEREKQRFELVTNRGGVATKVCRNSMTFGTRSGLRFTDTFGIHLPYWRFQTSAAGYEKQEWKYLDPSEYAREVRRFEPNGAKLVVRLSLRKADREP
jgi:hypothetical protein